MEGNVATFAPSLSSLFIGAVAMGIGGILQCVLAVSKIINERDLLIQHIYFLIVGAICRNDLSFSSLFINAIIGRDNWYGCIYWLGVDSLGCN
ncbi:MULTISPECIES: hypothetical protein [unclassified Gilliamella]|uniref:hypothetical protein n=1 Tax=unclassified Gilliamella TaxID=2685620 RepID=UPI001C3FF800|nr:hypothetical protein [Gilliamella apicola]